MPCPALVGGPSSDRCGAERNGVPHTPLRLGALAAEGEDLYRSLPVDAVRRVGPLGMLSDFFLPRGFLDL